MLERVTGFVGGHADGGEGAAMVVLGGEEERFLPRVIMIGEVAGDFVDRHGVQAGAIEDLAGGLGSAPAGIGGHTRVAVVSGGQLHLRVEAEEDAGQDHPPPLVEYHHRFNHSRFSVQLFRD